MPPIVLAAGHRVCGRCCSSQTRTFTRPQVGLAHRTARQPSAPPKPALECAAANDTWCIEFKGWFVSGDTCCETLTLSDAYSR